MNEKVIELAKRIKIVITDVDGILTDGKIAYGNYKDEYRQFNVQDGLGFKLLNKAGIRTAIITSKKSNALLRRAKELSVGTVYTNVKNKREVFNKILSKLKLNQNEACYLGDDLLDLSTLKAAGFSASVPTASPDVKNVVSYVTEKNAGDGAFRELCELILKSQNKWQDVLTTFE